MMTLKRLMPLAIIVASLHVAPSHAAPTQAGVTAAVRGDVDLLSVLETEERPVKSGEDVYLGDAINSHDDSGMQLLLLDETVFTIGANTEFTVDEFVYDPATGIGNVTTSLAKGVLRFVTGNVARGDPEDMVINLPTGTLGIRGTIGVAAYDGTETLVVLLGPGADNNAGARVGRLQVTSAGQSVDLTRPQFGTRIAPGQPPSPPFLLSQNEIAEVMSSLEAQPKPEEPDDSEAQGDGGEEDQADDGDTAGDDQAADDSAIADGEDSGEDATGLAGQDIAEGDSLADSTQTIDLISADATDTGDQGLLTASEILDGVSTFDQIRSIETGVANVSATGSFLQSVKNGLAVSILGSFAFNLDIDFGARTFGGGNSGISIDTSGAGGTINDSVSIVSVSYANDTGLAKGTLELADLSGGTCAVCIVGTEVRILNAGGIIAAEGFVEVTYDTSLNGDTTPEIGSGSGTAPFEDGLSATLP